MVKDKKEGAAGIEANKKIIHGFIQTDGGH